MAVMYHGASHSQACMQAPVYLPMHPASPAQIGGLWCARSSTRTGAGPLPGRSAVASLLLRWLSAGRCLLGEADGALYMAFMGTKQRRDLVTNAQVLQEPLWPEDLTPDAQDASQVDLHTAVWRL